MEHVEHFSDGELEIIPLEFENENWIIKRAKNEITGHDAPKPFSSYRRIAVIRVRKAPEIPSINFAILVIRIVIMTCIRS